MPPARGTPARTVWPVRTRPRSARSSPSSSRSRLVLPEPFAPRTATRSPGPSRQVTPSSRVRSPSVRVTSSTSYTDLPSRRVAKARSRVPSRGGGSSAISACAASIRNRGLLVRAGGPRRSQASSLRSRFCRRASVGGGLPGALGPGQHVRRVAAVVPADRPVADLPGLGGHLVQEPAVVGDDDERLPAAGQVRGEPADALDVEVVGRLVEDQQVGPGDQGGGERDPAALAAGQPRGRRVQPDPGQAEAVQHRTHRGVAGPLVHRAVAGEHRLAHRRARRLGALVDVPDPQPAGGRHPAGVRLLEPGEQPQQRASCRRRCGRPRRSAPPRRRRARPGPARRWSRTPCSPTPG